MKKTDKKLDMFNAQNTLTSGECLVMKRRIFDRGILDHGSVSLNVLCRSFPALDALIDIFTGLILLKFNFNSLIL